MFTKVLFLDLNSFKFLNTSHSCNFSIDSWLISILKRKIIDHYRKTNSKKGQAEVRMNFYNDGENEGDWIEERVPQSWDNDVEKKLENTELQQQIDLCTDKLPKKYAMVFRMKTIQEIVLNIH